MASVSTPTSATTDQVAALTEAQAETRSVGAAQVAALASASAAGFTGWYSRDAITEWAAALAKAVNPVLLILARNADAYVAQAVTDLGRGRMRPAGAVDVDDLRDGVTHAGAYARATDAYRYQQSRWDAFGESLPPLGQLDPTLAPPDFATPLDAAVLRAKQVAEMDTQLVVQQQERKTMQAAESVGKVTGQRRVIHPELSRGGTCGLCVAASDRVYKPRELRPIHLRCHCTTMPIYNRNDPGSALNADDFKRLYADAGSTNAKDLKATRYRVDDNGQLGPLLVPAEQKSYRPPEGRQVRAASSPAKKAAVLRSVLAKQEAVLPKAQALADADPDKWGDYLKLVTARIESLHSQYIDLAR